MYEYYCAVTIFISVVHVYLEYYLFISLYLSLSFFLFLVTPWIILTLYYYILFFFKLHALYSRTSRGERHDARESFHFWQENMRAVVAAAGRTQATFSFFFPLLTPYFRVDGRCRSTIAAGTPH